MDKEDLGRLIRQKRKEKKMTQGVLAERLHVDVSTVSKWEAGKNAVSVQCHKAISEVLDIPLVVLQGNQECETSGSSSPETKSGDDPSKEDEDSQNGLPENHSQQKQHAKGKKKFFFLGAGVILLAVAALVFFIWKGNQYSYIVHSEYFAVFQEQDACYLVAECKGEFNRDILNEYVEEFRTAYEDYFEKVDVIVILFFEDYNEKQILSLDTADAVAVLEPLKY